MFAYTEEMIAADAANMKKLTGSIQHSCSAEEIAEATAFIEAIISESPALTDEFLAARKAACDEYAATIVRTEEWML